MNLSSKDFEKLNAAMLSAFPDTYRLRKMVKLKLEKSIEAIAGGNNLDEVIFNLIERAESEGWLKVLVIKAHEDNPGNEKLKEFVENLNSEPPTAPCKTFLHPWGIEVDHYLRLDIPQQEPPPNFNLPNGYQYLGKLAGGATDHLYRQKDGHIVILISGLNPHLIDKYTITNQQFCFFLNEIIDKRIAQVECLAYSGAKYAIDEQGHPLVVDALDYWQYNKRQSTPYLYAAPPWGITYQNYTWQPVSESELLPATLITWWGARLYSLWAHEKLSFSANEATNFLPTVRQWKVACVQDMSTQKELRYPWGEIWQRERVNYAGYWAGCEVIETKWQDIWADQSRIYSQTRPLPVASLDAGKSPIGCVQMLGNVWEWCADNPGAYETSKAVRGGSCMSPQEYCDANYSIAWRPGESNEYIGFRCCFPLT